MTTPRSTSPDEVLSAASLLASFEVIAVEKGIFPDYVMSAEGLTHPMLPCGCFPHITRVTNRTAMWCDTEQQGYCNFECECDDE